MRVRPRSSTRTLAAALAAALLLALCFAAAPASAADPKDALAPISLTPDSPDLKPPGFAITPRQARRVAERVPEVRKALREHARAEAHVTIPTYLPDRLRWVVSYWDADDDLVEVHISGRTGRVLEVWTGPQIQLPLTRGYKPSLGRALNSPLVWIPLAVLFVAPFVDPRRPFRLIHLDLLMLLGFGLSHFFLNRGEPELSVPLVYPFLGYLLLRMLLAGFRPRPRLDALIPFARTHWLAFGLFALVAFRIGLNIADSTVIDVSFASVVGADRIMHGEELYVFNEVYGDTYGPLAYIAYIPFELIFPSNGQWDSLPAAHAAAISFDLLTLLGLFLLGRQLRPGAAGNRLGIALAFAWAAFPYSTFVLQGNTNDGLISAGLVFALLALRSAPGRGAVLGLATMTKFVPAALAPLFLTGTGGWRPRSALGFSGAFAAVVALAVLAFLPDGGLREFWDATLGYQLSRESPLSLWGMHPSLEWLQTALKVGAVGLAIAVMFVPRRRDVRQIAALAAAVIIALQITGTYWLYFYLAWFTPLALVTIMAAYGSAPAETGRESRRTESTQDLVAA